MEPDPARVAETTAWLAKASDDLRAASIDLAASPPLAEDAVFHCQQAAEKTLKALLTWHDRPFRKTHNLEELGEQCLTVEPTLRPEIDLVVPLTEYAWRFRYPGEPEDLGPDEPGDALRVAGDLHRAVVARLPREAQP